MPSLSIIVDAIQQRIKADTLSSLVTGLDWSPTYFSNTWVDPITNTCMLMPAPLLAAWATSNTGIFAKLGMSDITFDDSSNWSSYVYDAAPVYYYKLQNTSGAGGQTNISQPMNQPMCVEYWQPDGSNSKYEILSCGWSATGDGSAGVSLRFYADGTSEVWKSGVIVGSGYSVAGNSQAYFAPQNGQTGQTATASQAPAGVFVKVLLIPFRDRELLVYSSAGGGFSHIFLDLPDSTAGNTITDAAPFWFSTFTGPQAVIRISQIKFQSSGYRYGSTSAWRSAPPAGTPNYLVFQSLTSGGSVSVTEDTTYNPYGVPYPLSIAVSLSGSGAKTPFVYGARVWYGPTPANTVGSEVDVIDYTRSLDLEVSDSISGVHATMVLSSPQALADAGVPAIKTQCHRPINIFSSGGKILTGVGEPPHVTDSNGFDGDGYDLNVDVEIQIRDYSKLAEEYIFMDPIPLDGLSLLDAYTALAQTMGFIANVSPSASAFTLGDAGSCSGGEFNVCVQVGDKGLEWLDRLHQTYAGNWAHFVDGDGNFCLIDPADMPSVPTLTLYRSIADAVSAGGLEPDEAYKYVYRSLKWQTLAPEANDVWVTGEDPRTGRPIVAHYLDADSANPTIGPSDRHANWLGFARKYAWIDPTLTTIDLVTQVLNILAPKVTQPRTICEFECDYLDGLSKGALIKLDKAMGFARGTDGETGTAVIVRLKTFSGSFQQVGDELARWAPCRYVAESTPNVEPLGVHGTSLNSILRSWALKAVSKQIVWDDGQIMAKRPILNMVGP